MQGAAASGGGGVCLPACLLTFCFVYLLLSLSVVSDPGAVDKLPMSSQSIIVTVTWCHLSLLLQVTT